MSGLILAGDVFIDRFTDGGVATGYRDAVNTTKLEITHPDPDKKDRISRMQATLGQALDSVLFPKPTEISIAIDDQPADILAMALLATETTISVTGTTVTDEAKTLILNKWISLAQRNISASGFNLSTVAVPGTPLVENTDYKVHREAGLVMALNSGAAVACLIDYTYGNLAGTRLSGGGRTTINCKLLLNGTNKATGKLCRLEIDKATLAPSAPIDWLSGEYITTELKGTVSIVSPATVPYRYEETS
jgi:hypothetical protein